MTSDNDYYNSGDSMIDAIAISSPSGKMSKRARKAADRRWADKVFTPDVRAAMKPKVTQPTEVEILCRNIGQIEDLLTRGMSPKGYKKALSTWRTRLAELSK